MSRPQRFCLSIFKNPEPHPSGEWVRYQEYLDQEILANHLNKALDQAGSEVSRIHQQCRGLNRRLLRARLLLVVAAWGLLISGLFNLMLLGVIFGL